MGGGTTTRFHTKIVLQIYILKNIYKQKDTVISELQKYNKFARFTIGVIFRTQSSILFTQTVNLKNRK